MRNYKRLSRHYQANFRRQHKKTKRHLLDLTGHPFVVPVVTFLFLFTVATVGLVLFGSQTIGASDSHVITISIDGKERTLPTRANTVRDLLKRLSINHVPEDDIKPGLDTPILEDNFRVVVNKARPVTVIDNGHKATVLTAHQQPRLIAAQAGITLYPEDGINLDSPPEINAGNVIIGEQVVVDRATPTNLNLYGTPIQLRTRAKTVGELLDQKRIKLSKGDTLQPSRSTQLTANTQIFVIRKGKQIVNEDVAIAAPVMTEDDPTMANGRTAVKEEGREGKKVVTYELELQNGKEVSRKAIQEVVVTEPIKRVVARGTKVLLSGNKAEWLAAAGISPSDYAAVDYIMERESHWNPAAINSSSCIGLGQRCGASVLIADCPNWQVDPVCQLQHFSRYASRYGGWQGAYQAWQVQGWW